MAEQPAWDDPERIGDYWIASRLGAGGQGVVYEAYDAAGQRVALKVLHREAGTEVQERFRKEAEAARAVPPFCTARALAVSFDHGRPFLVSEFVPGPTLAARVTQEGPLEEDALLRLAVGVATALAAIHSAGVVHRDLKPGNVLLGPDGPRIIDFGIARTSDMSLTATGALIGTPGYMAPEVLDGKRATPASDVFAWAAVMVFAATGNEPFRGTHIGEVIYRTSRVDPDLSGIPAGFRPLVAAALAKEPRHRPSSVELLASLVGTRPEPQTSPTALLADGARRADRAGAPPWAPATLVEPPLGEVAEAALRELPSSVWTVARELLLRMVEPEIPGGSDTVRSTSWEELYAGRSDQEREAVRRCVDAFVRAGVLRASDDGSCRPVSAALLPAWQRLREWVAADRDQLRAHRALGRAALEWHANGERTEDLLQGSTLRSHLAWAARAPAWLRLSPLEQRFLDAARARETRARRRRRQALSAGAAVLALSLTAGGVFWHRAEENARQRDRETARATVRAAADLRTRAPDTYRLLNLAAWRIAELPETRAALLSAATGGRDETLTLPESAGGADGTALSTDGMTMTRHTSFGLETWDLGRRRAASGKPVLRDEPVATVPGTRTPIVSPDGRTALTRRDDGYRRVPTGTTDGAGEPVGDLGDGVPEYLTNAGDLLVRSDAGDRVVDAAGRTVATADTIVALSPDGDRLASCAGADQLVIRSPREATTFTVPTDVTCAELESVQFSPDGRSLVVFGGEDVEEATVYDVRTGRPRHTVWLQDLHHPVFSSAGTYLVGQSAENGLEVRSGQDDFAGPLLSVPEPGSNVEHLALDERSGTLAYTTPGSREIHRIDLRPVLEPGRAVRVPRAAGTTAVQYSADGGRVLVRGSSDRDPVLRVVDTDSGRPVGDTFVQTGWGGMEGHPTAALSADGRWLAYDRVPKSEGADDWEARVVDLTTGRQTPVPLSLTDPTHWPNSLELSPDGRYLALTSGPAGVLVPDDDQVLQIYDLRERKKVYRYRGRLWDGVFTPDGRHHVTARGTVLDLATGRTRRLPFGRAGYVRIAVSPDGETLAGLDADGGLDLWDVQEGTRTARIPAERAEDREDSEAVRWEGPLAFSQDGTLLAKPRTSGGIRLWDVSDHAHLHTILPHIPDLGTVTFRHDDLRYADHGRLHTVDLAAPALAAAVCEDVGRDITRDEWEKYIPSAAYRRVC